MLNGYAEKVLIKKLEVTDLIQFFYFQNLIPIQEKHARNLFEQDLLSILYNDLSSRSDGKSILSDCLNPNIFEVIS